GTQAWFQVASLDQAIAVAKHIHASGMAPKGYEKAEAIVTAIIFGGELGLGPLASLQSIAVINGKPSIYGDAMLALCQRDSAYVSHDEGLEGDLKSDDSHGWCEVVVKNHHGTGERRVRRTFSVADAKRAKLWSK